MSKKHKRKHTREPLEYDLPFEPEEQLPERPKHRTVLAYILDQDEVNELIRASNAPYVEPPVSVQPTDYSTYSEDEVLALLDANFRPKRKKKK